MPNFIPYDSSNILYPYVGNWYPCINTTIQVFNHQLKKVANSDDGLIRAETCREYRSYLIKTLSIVAKQKVLLFTVI
jgi:hypothetical protein